MKVTYTFIDELVDESGEANRRRLFESGASIHAAVWDYLAFLRSQLKHGEMSEAEYKVYDALRDKLTDLLDEEGVLDLF